MTISQVTTFPEKNFNPVLSNTNFSFSTYHVSFNLMSRDIDIISVNIVFLMISPFL